MLYDNRQILEKNGFYYPEAGLKKTRRLEIRHYYLMHEMTKDSSFAHWDAFLNEISKVSQENIILSHENFFSPNVDPRKIATRLNGNEIKLIVYLRNPIDYIESCYREWVQNVKYDKGIDEFFLWRRKWISYRKLIEKWEKVIGTENIKIGIFDKNCLYEKDVKSDFLKKIGLKDIKIREGNDYNRTLTSKEILTILLKNRGVEGGDYLRLSEKILEEIFKNGNQDKRIVKNEIIDHIRRYYEDEFLYLRDRLGFYYDGRSKYLSLPYDDFFEDIEIETRKT